MSVVPISPSTYSLAGPPCRLPLATFIVLVLYLCTRAVRLPGTPVLMFPLGLHASCTYVYIYTCIHTYIYCCPAQRRRYRYTQHHSVHTHARSKTGTNSRTKDQGLVWCRRWVSKQYQWSYHEAVEGSLDVINQGRGSPPRVSVQSSQVCCEAHWYILLLADLRASEATRQPAIEACFITCKPGSAQGTSQGHAGM